MDIVILHGKPVQVVQEIVEQDATQKQTQTVMVALLIVNSHHTKIYGNLFQ